MARMRTKRHIPERMDRCRERWFDAPMLNRGKWREACGFPEDAEIFLEIGCGKGKFCTETAPKNPDALYIALERDSSVILAAIEKAHAEEIPNLFFINADAQLLDNLFDEDEINRIYINFCDPWSRRNKPKRRLTYRDFLEQYKRLMRKGGKIMFKTDNDELFDFSLGEFEACGFELSELTRDLHSSEYEKDNVRTEFEQKFADQGIKIKRVVASLV
ncbi:MAG: tRNA (guanosine(46)-N7)-methyltransferase TrmB [Clostridiales bacterium]|nr:tRNA (guanosine(46)-N7)-methyltransferase TrmB [Clostridiales bacterium]